LFNLLVALAFTGLLAACSSGPAGVGAPTSEAPVVEEPAAEEPTAEEPVEVDLKTTGPGGEEATMSSEVSLTAEELAEVAEGTYTAALLWHTSAAFTEAVSKGVYDAFEEMGIEIVAETNAEFDSAKQASDVETVLALEPDIILSLVLDPVSGARAFQPAVENGVQLVFLSNVPEGYVHGEDYVGIVTDDLAGMGIAAAELLGDAMGGEGKVGYIFHDAAYYVTNQRDQGFKTWIEAKYPGIEIVAEEGMADPTRAEELASAMLTRNPEITGFYTPWATPADGVLAALRAAGRDDVKVVTLDLDTNVALDMVEGGNVAGIAADLAYELGRTMATEGAYGLLGKEAPPFTVVPAIKVTADNVVEAWNQSLAQNPPAEVLDVLGVEATEAPATESSAVPFFDSPLDFDFSTVETDPNGNAAVPASEVTLTEEEIAQIKEGGYSSAHLWAGAGEWYNAIDSGATAKAEELGIEVTARTDAEFDPAKQANDVDTVMALSPDIILTLIVDPVSGAQAFKPVVDQGIVLALADNGAEGYKPGEEYVSIVTGNHFGMGQAAAELMNEALGGSGEVGMIFHDADFFVTNNRDNAFRAAIEQNYPNITIVDARGFTEEPATFDVASAMLQTHPEIDGIYVAWDVAAEGAVEAIRAAGRDDVHVITHDLGVNNALDMIEGGSVYGTVADLPFAEGEALMTLAAYDLLGKEAPPFVTVGYIQVTKDNIAEAWEQSLGKALPEELSTALNE
jgi:ribose transport system substrate-binding protein